ncbi:hypothetical protein JXM67_05630 [candidate division WOR-3 bacterium]|nr:hypothetical protein [candidate division WOR-3 bacterium]
MQSHNLRLLAGAVLTAGLLAGCGQPAELSRDQYLELKSEILRPPGEVIPKIIFPFKVLTMLIGDDSFFRIDAYYPERRLYGFGGVIYRGLKLRTARIVCHSRGISFSSYNHAHKKYSLSGLTYKEAVDESIRLARLLMMDRKKYGKESSNPEIEEKSARLNLELEGVYYEDMFLIKVDGQGKTEIYISPPYECISFADVKDSIQVDPYRLVRIMPEPQTPAEELFDIAAQIKGARRVIVSDSLYHYYEVFAAVYPLSDLDTLDSDPGVFRSDCREINAFIHIKTIDTVYFNGKLVDDCTLKSLLDRSESGISVVVAVDSTVECGKIIETLKLIKDDLGPVGNRVFIIPYSIIEGHEPRLDTRFIPE